MSRIHSSAMDTMLGVVFFREVPFFPWVFAGTVVVSLVFQWGAVNVSLRRGIAAFVAVCGGLVLVVILAFVFMSLEIPLVQPAFIFVPAAGIVLAFCAAATDKDKERLQITFGRNLSEEVVKEILESPEGITLSGELKEITILVSDLRGFTPLTESVSPMVILSVANRYLEKMTDIIMRHGGCINEIMGDGILVFFGAPWAKPDDTRRAVACALAMQRAMPELNAGSRALDLPELRMGIGINTGVVVVGSIGSEKRQKYTAIGSPVNVTFRVEAHTSAGEILVTPAIFDRYSEDLQIDSTREVRLKGIREPITLYSVVVLKSERLEA